MKKLTDESELRLLSSEAALHRCYYKKMFWKHQLNLQENIHV